MRRRFAGVRAELSISQAFDGAAMGDRAMAAGEAAGELSVVRAKTLVAEALHYFQRDRVRAAANSKGLVCIKRAWDEASLHVYAPPAILVPLGLLPFGIPLPELEPAGNVDDATKRLPTRKPVTLKHFQQLAILQTSDGSGWVIIPPTLLESASARCLYTALDGNVFPCSWSDIRQNAADVTYVILVSDALAANRLATVAIMHEDLKVGGICLREESYDEPNQHRSGFGEESNALAKLSESPRPQSGEMLSQSGRRCSETFSTNARQDVAPTPGDNVSPTFSEGNVILRRTRFCACSAHLKRRGYA